MDIYVRPAKKEDIISLKDRLRKEDAEEVIAAGDESPESALAISFERSAEAYTIELEGVPVAMFGVVKTEGPISGGRVWFLGSPEMAKIKKSFVKESRRYIKGFLLRYPFLFNYVDVRYKTAISWLRSCGAYFYEDKIQGNGSQFVMFTIVRH